MSRFLGDIKWKIYLKRLNPKMFSNILNGFARFPTVLTIQKLWLITANPTPQERALKPSVTARVILIITIPATKGHESASPVTRGHFDMVCVKDAASPHDFEKDPLKLVPGDISFTPTRPPWAPMMASELPCAWPSWMIRPVIHPANCTACSPPRKSVGMDGAYALDFTPIADATRDDQPGFRR